MNDMVDMSRFVEAKSDQLNSDDLLGAPRTITITRVVGNDGDQPVSIFYQGDNGKPFKPCKTIRRVLLAVWGRYAQDYVGRSMTLYRDDSVTFGGLDVGGIRISHMSHLEKETIVVVMKSKGKKAGVKVYPLVQQVDKAAAWTSTFVAKLCTFETSADLEAAIEAQSKTLAKLEAERPELSADLRDTIALRREMLADNDDPFATEGRDQSQMGETAIPLDEWAERLDAAENIDVLGMAFDGAVADYPEERDALTRLREARKVVLAGKGA